MPSPRIIVEDVDAFSDVSNGSTISVGSATSGGSGRMPRPPSGGSKRSKSAQGRRSHIAKSPYSSQQFKQQLPPKPAARNMWITAMKNGNSSLSTENSPMRSWATSRPTQRKTNKVGAGRTRHVSDAVQIGDLKNKNHVRSASLSASEPQMTPGGVAYKPKEDYYDEIIELKKIINALKAENNIINTKLHRVEGENVLKDRKIEDLLNSRKQPEDTRRTLTDKKGDTSAIVNSLKQKLHALERTLKDKEAELSQLQRDLKMTNIEELQLQSETYYQEVQRLQLALIEMQQSQVREPFGNTTSVRSHPTQKGKVAAHSLQKLTDENNHLRAENQGLKKDLLIAIENASTGGKKVPLKVEYADMNRGQLLYKIRDLEEKIQESDETKARTKKEFSPEDQQSKDQFRRRSISTGHEAAIVLKGTSSQKLAQLQEREAELLEEREKQRNVIERLKEDRTHYRAVADDLREKLKMAEEELERLREEKSPSNQRRQSNTSLSSVRRSSSTKEIPSAENKGGDLDQMLEEFQQQRAAKTLQRQWRGYKGRQVEENGRLLREQQNQAAATLQRNWRKHRHEVRRRESQEEAVTEIQAALRGHVVRCQRLEQLGGELEIADTEDAIVNIQSALRAHAARARHQENRGKKVTSRDSGGSHAHCINGPESVEDAGSNSSGLSIGKRDSGPTSSRQKRSSLTGSRRSLISAPRFSNISEQSDEDDVVMTSSSRTNLKARTEATGVLKVSNNNEKNQRKKKSTFEIADSDDDNDNDDDDVSVITPQRRSLDTGLNQPRPALSPSSRDMGPPSTVSRQETASLVSRSRGSLDTDQQSLEFSKDETMQRRGLSRSKRPVSAERPSLSRKDNTTKVLMSSESASSGWARSSAVSEDDSDEDDVVITSQKTKGKPAAGDGKAVRPSLSRKLPEQRVEPYFFVN